MLGSAYSCMYITEEHDASEEDELSADTSQLLSVSNLRILKVS